MKENCFKTSQGRIIVTRNEIDKFCESFLDSDLSPEDFFNQLVDNSKTAFSFEDSKLLITLFYTLRYMDERILNYAMKTEAARNEQL